MSHMSESSTDEPSLAQPSAGADGYSVIWTQLDRPPPPPPPPPPPVAPAAPPFEGSVAVLAFDPHDPTQKACIVQRGGEQLYLGLGKKLGDYTCTSIGVDEEGWFVDVLCSSGSSGRIRIRREESR